LLIFAIWNLGEDRRLKIGEIGNWKRLLISSSASYIQVVQRFGKTG